VLQRVFSQPQLHQAGSAHRTSSGLAARLAFESINRYKYLKCPVTCAAELLIQCQSHLTTARHNKALARAREPRWV